MCMTRVRPILSFVVFLVIVTVLFYFYISPSSSIARGSGTVLSDNWWEGLNWIKNNTAECATIATYWDPGHFITGIARRPVVFDGASQGATRTLTLPGNATEEEIQAAAVIPQYRAERVRENGTEVTKVTTARIQDIATTLYTADEDTALRILSKYRNPGCDEMYYIASSDLIGKSVWWSYFATWTPVEKGVQYNYAILSLSQQRDIDLNTRLYIYPISTDQSILLVDANSTLTPLFQQGNLAPVRVERIVYFLPDGSGISRDVPDAEVKGLVWVDPSRQVVVFAPPQIADSLFTRLFFMNGQGLEHFQLVGNWGGELKLFRVTFD